MYNVVRGSCAVYLLQRLPRQINPLLLLDEELHTDKVRTRISAVVVQGSTAVEGKEPTVRREGR